MPRVSRRSVRIAAHVPHHQWANRYLRLVAWSDFTVVITAVVVAQWLRFGSDAGSKSFGGGGQPVLVISLLLAVAWILSLRASQTLDRRIIGSGATEYSRVLTACFTVFGLLAIVVLIAQLEVSRGYFAIALPLGTLGLLASRWLWRHRLVSNRRRGQNMERVLVVGSLDSSVHLVKRLRQSPELGFEVIGLCLPVSDAALGWVTVGGKEIPVYGDFDEVTLAVSASGATTVAVTSAEALGHQAMQDLSWNLQGMEVEMMVAPGVTDVAGPRMMVRPVAGLPLLHIDKPTYEGANRLRKAIVDRAGAVLILLASAPVLLGIAVLIKIDSGGTVFYRATRIGLNNEPFTMWKFRTMVPDADEMRVDLAGDNEGAGVLFKIRDDPRVTRVGKVLRQYSLDEIPQLLNVLVGTMSLVGPRPPLQEEVEKYDGRVSRRMLVKPGMTGLWQVSGRSDLSWEEAVRLDLSYVENWSIMQDMTILWRTFRAVISKDGAY